MLLLQILKLEQGPSIIEVKVRTSLRAKHAAIRITSIGLVELVLPKRIDQDKAYNFLIQKEAWIRNKLAKIPIVKNNIPDKIAILDIEHEIILDNQYINVPIKVIDNKIIISNVIAPDKISLIIVPYLKKILKQEIEDYAALKAKELNVSYNKISIRELTSRWGSCSQDGNLSFSWRLVLAPKYVMEYLVVHELCHLLEMNHSYKFWRLVYKIYPEYSKAEKWLKTHGRTLHNIFYK